MKDRCSKESAFQAQLLKGKRFCWGGQNAWVPSEAGLHEVTLAFWGTQPFMWLWQNRPFSCWHHAFWCVLGP